MHGAADGDVSRALLSLSVDAARIGTFEVDVATGRLTWNRQMFELIGVDPADFHGRLSDAYRHIHPDDVPRVAAEVDAALGRTGAYTTEYRVLLADGGVRHLSARGRMLADADGRPVRLVGAAHDVTAERESSGRVHAALESLAIGYLAMDADWRITYVNAQAEHITGRPRGELLGGTVWELFPAAVGTVFEDHYRRAAASGEAVTFEAHYPEPLDVWVEVRAVPENGGVALYFLDVTDQRRVQEEAEQAARRSALLAAVTEQLTGTLDAERAVAYLARLVVPALADWCVVTLVDDEGRPGAGGGCGTSAGRTPTRPSGLRWTPTRSGASRRCGRTPSSSGHWSPAGASCWTPAPPPPSRACWSPARRRTWSPSSPRSPWSSSRCAAVAGPSAC